MTYALIVPLYAIALTSALVLSLVLLRRDETRGAGFDVLCAALGSMVGLVIANIPMATGIVAWLHRPHASLGMVTFMLFVGPFIVSVLGTTAGAVLGLRFGRWWIAANDQALMAKRSIRAVRTALLAGVVGMVFFGALDTLMWMFPPSLGWGAWKWTRYSPVVVNLEYAVALETRSTNSLGLAEYDQCVEVYGTDPEHRGSLGRMPIEENTGGTTRVLLYAGREHGRAAARLVHRDGESVVDLASAAPMVAAKDTSNWTFLGTFAGGPPRFVPVAVWPESVARVGFDVR